MSIVLIENGDLFQSKMPVWVNAVNCQGIMGAGIAKRFADLFPDYYADYRAKCKNRAIQVGQVDLYCNTDGPHIVSFPTMHFPGRRSDLLTICDGLRSLRRLVSTHDLQGLAIPALGCGIGGLPFEQVARVVEVALGDLDIPIELYAPLERMTR